MNYFLYITILIVLLFYPTIASVGYWICSGNKDILKLNLIDVLEPIMSMDYMFLFVQIMKIFICLNAFIFGFYAIRNLILQYLISNQTTKNQADLLEN